MSTVGIHGGAAAVVVGATDVNIISPIPLPVEIVAPLGPNVAADSVSVTLATDEDPIEVTATDFDIRNLTPTTDIVAIGDGTAVATIRDLASNDALNVAIVDAAGNHITSFGGGGAGQTDVEARAVQTISGILDGNGDTVVLELNGAVAACALFPDAGTFNGTVIFEVSSDGGVEYNSVQANGRSEFSPSGNGINPSNLEWVFALGGGETHVRVRVIAYTSGSSLVTLTGTYTQNAAIQNAMFPSGGGDRPRAAVMVGGRFDAGSAHVPRVRNDNDGSADMAWVVRDMQGGFRVGNAMVGANDFGKAIGGIDINDVFQFAEIRNADPASNTNAIVVRNLPSGVQNATIADEQTGRRAWVDSFHTLRIAEPFKLVGTPFFDSVKDPNFWAEVVTGTGTVTQTLGEVTLATGTTANSSASYQTVRIARWIPGTSNHFRGEILITPLQSDVNNVRRWGAFNTTDGLFFQVTTSPFVLAIGIRKNSTDTLISSGVWNEDNTFVLDTNYHSYEIVYAISHIHFYVDGILVHTVEPITTVNTATLNFPATITNTNTGGGTLNTSVIAASLSITRLGRPESETFARNIVGASTVVLKQSGGKLHRIVVNDAGTLLTIYDNTAASGTILGTVDLGANFPTSLEYMVPFQNGLTMVTTGAAVNLTVIYE